MQSLAPEHRKVKEEPVPCAVSRSKHQNTKEEINPYAVSRPEAPEY